MKPGRSSRPFFLAKGGRTRISRATGRRAVMSRRTGDAGAQPPGYCVFAVLRSGTPLSADPVPDGSPGDVRRRSYRPRPILRPAEEIPSRDRPDAAKMRDMPTREFPASIGQRLLWILDHYRGGDGALNCPLVLRFRGRLERSQLERSLRDLTSRHEAVRTTFAGRGPRVRQRIHEPRDVPIVDVDLSGDPDGEAALRRSVSAELGSRIDPTGWPLRATLWHMGPRDHVLCLNMHHLVTDAWSGGVLFNDLRLLLERAAGRDLPLPRVGWQYAQFADWQRRILAGHGLRSRQEYWRRKLEGMQPPELPLSPEPQRPEGLRTGHVSVEILPETAEALRRLARAHRTTLFSVMLAVYYACLTRHTAQLDLSVASLFANRKRREVQYTVGFLANMVVLRTDLRKAKTFGDLVRLTHDTVMDGFANESLPYQMLPLDAVRAGGKRADDVVFQMMPRPMGLTRIAGTEAEVLVPEDIGTRFELELSLVPRSRGFRGILFYNRHRIDARWARGFAADYAASARTVARTTETPLRVLLN